MPQRRVFRLAFLIATGARRVTKEDYERHIAQMIHQIFPTAPGERVNLRSHRNQTTGNESAPTGGCSWSNVRIELPQGQVSDAGWIT